MIKKSNDVTQKTIAKQAQVSQTVVSHVINEIADKYNIAEETQKRVLEIAAKYGYKLNLVAKGLRLRRTYTIGLIFPDIVNPFFSGMVALFEEELKKADFNVLLSCSKGDQNSEKLLIDLHMAKRVDGLIIVPVSDEETFSKNMLSYSCPTVVVMREFPHLKRDVIDVDNYEIGYKGTKYLLDIGYTNIHLLPSYEIPWATGKIYEGYRQVLSENNIKERGSLKNLYGKYKPTGEINNGFLRSVDYGSSYNAVQKVAKKPRPKLAIFSTTAMQTLGALHAIKDSNCEIGEEIGFVGVDFGISNIKIDKNLPVIFRPTKEIARQSVQILLDKISGTSGNIERHIVVPADFSMLG